MSESEISHNNDDYSGILLVDDTLMMRYILSGLCTKHGFEVVGQAVDGQEAIELYLIHKPMIVLMDINMPKVDGIEATRRILEINPEAKIIIISVSAEKNIIYSALQAGACSYLIKPINPEKLLEVINNIVEPAA